jgi:DNA-directed RNA polymerase II subunit RPB9
MLYPKEDRENNVLMYACRTCQFSEQAPTACVYRNQLSNTVGETAGVTQDVGSDPTVCGYSRPASVHQECCSLACDADSPGNDAETLITCTLCGEEIACYRCGKPDVQLMAVSHAIAL